MTEDTQVLTEEERKAIRADVYTRGSEEATDFSDDKIRFITERCSKKRVLDLGCVDHHEVNAASRFWLHKAICAVSDDVTGLDYYGPGVDKLNSQGYSVVHADAQTFKFTEPFDVVVAGDLIEHLPNLEGLFTSVFDATVSGGSFVISTPNPWCWKYSMYHLVKGKMTPVNREHVSWFCHQTLENLGKRFGFKVAAVSFCSRRAWEKLIPIPSRIKHTTLCVEFTKA